MLEQQCDCDKEQATDTFENFAVTLPIDFTLRAKPDTPTDLLLKQDSDKLKLVWNAPESDGGSLIFEYEVQWNQGFGEQYKALARVNLRHLTIKNLDSSLKYRFRVRARNLEGYSGFSNVVYFE